LGNAEGLDGYIVTQEAKEIANEGFKRTDGTAVGGTIYEIILKKK
jgi:hypothetical protein